MIMSHDYESGQEHAQHPRAHFFRMQFNRDQCCRLTYSVLENCIAKLLATHGTRLVRARGRSAAARPRARRVHSRPRCAVAVAPRGSPHAAVIAPSRAASLTHPRCLLFGVFQETHRSASPFIICIPRGRKKQKRCAGIQGLKSYCIFHIKTRGRSAAAPQPGARAPAARSLCTHSRPRRAAAVAPRGSPHAVVVAIAPSRAASLPTTTTSALRAF